MAEIQQAGWNQGGTCEKQHALFKCPNGDHRVCECDSPESINRIWLSCSGHIASDGKRRSSAEERLDRLQREANEQALISIGSLGGGVHMQGVAPGAYVGGQVHLQQALAIIGGVSLPFSPKTAAQPSKSSSEESSCEESSSDESDSDAAPEVSITQVGVQAGSINLNSEGEDSLEALALASRVGGIRMTMVEEGATVHGNVNGKMTLVKLGGITIHRPPPK